MSDPVLKEGVQTIEDFADRHADLHRVADLEPRPFAPLSRRHRYPIPRWWRDCRDRKRHHVSILSRRDVYQVEYFCTDCRGGAGRGEIVKAR